MVYESELYHHGIKGMRWGVRRYQDYNGDLTYLGRQRYGPGPGPGQGQGIANFSKRQETNNSDEIKRIRTKITGKQYVDTYIDAGTTLSRVQAYKEFEDLPFYATYKHNDVNKYIGLFGENLKSRAARDARKAEKMAKASGSEEYSELAKSLRQKSDNIKIYQLKIQAQKKLKVPSDENASNIVGKLLEEKEFNDNVKASISDSKSKMRRPSQQLLFRQAERALKNSPSEMTQSEKIAVYKALNLTLTNHNEQEISAQNRLYSELKKNGYNALLDYNDKEYSSYHASRPMIIFDTDSVKLQSVMETDPKQVEKMYKVYNTERIAKEAAANSVDLISKYGASTISECDDFVSRKLNKYLMIN